MPIAQFQLADRLPILARQFPNLRIQLHVTDHFVDLVQEGFDVVVRSHYPTLTDPDLVRRRMRDEPITLVAAPSDFAQHGVPQTPETLSGHDGLMTGMRIKFWQLRDAGGHSVQAAPKPVFYADESVSLIQAAEMGLGIFCATTG